MKKKIIIIVLIVIILFFLLYFIGIIPHKKYPSAFFGIEEYHSEIDMDNDTIDDQSDILLNAYNYVEKKPKYKSKYYATGYPDDEYGVCTDVVAFALLNAGYDIKELLYQDVLENKELYDIEVIDKNIDFRRVLNLNVYFSHHAISLTTDLKETDSWQGGDIVVFKRHIGIVSNMRNYKGIPFVIHHASPYQINYEEDILERDKDSIIGHFRLS